MKIHGIECNEETKRNIAARNPGLFLTSGAPVNTAARLLQKVAEDYLSHAPREPVNEGVERESDLHDDILDLCRRKGWIALHGSTAHKTKRSIGEPDFTILADAGRVFFFECKSKEGKVRPEQAALHAWAAKLGHTVHVIRSLEALLEIARDTS